MSHTVPRLSLFAALLVAAPVGASGASHFWLSTSSSGISGSESPAVGLTVGDTLTMYLWGRPDTGRQFDAVSIDIAASATGLDFVDGSYVFYNEVDGSTNRFEETFDSSSLDPDDAPNPLESFWPPEDIEDFGDIDELRGLRGFTVTDTSSIRGPGPVCADGETGCEVASDGDPAWLIASFDVAAVTAGSVDLSLQIGDRGVVEKTIATGDYDLDGEVDLADVSVWSGAYGSTQAAPDGNADGVVDAADYTLWRAHFGDTSTLLTAADSDVRFGYDTSTDGEPTYNASTEKQMTGKVGEDPDASFTISAPATARAAPEPTAVVLAAVGLGGLIRIRDRRPTDGRANP